LVLWGIAVVLLGAGWWGDQAGFWSSKPFITNMFFVVDGCLVWYPACLDCAAAHARANTHCWRDGWIAAS
jgi:hypothetical protein